MQFSNWKTSSFSVQMKIADKLSWMIDGYLISDASVHVNGWVISPFYREIDLIFLANEREIFKPDILYYDPQLQDLLLPDFPESAYRFSVTFPANFHNAFSSLCFLPSGELDSRDVLLRSWYFPDPRYDQDPLPGGDNIHRVIGNRSDEKFRVGGATLANRINQYLQFTRGKDFGSIGNVLDWGCGCARVSRYVRKLGCESLTGVDVDRTNVDWCRANLPWFSVCVSGLAPPLPFPDQTFDLVFGISVFTHLRESWQFAWLSELARTLKPGGLAIMTIMSEGQAALQGASREMVDQIAQSGFLITDDNDQLRLSTGSENYYVNVYHSAKYIFREWAKFFKVLDYVPFIGTHQDMVILERI
jgi:SAM-dependent methyltransferase